MIPLRLVIDTNIVVSAALKLDGLQRTVLILALSKPATLYVTEAILAEYQDVLQRPRIDIPQRPTTATPAAHRESLAFHHAYAYTPGDIRSRRQHVSRMR